jgi:hypothetical protein
MAIYKGLLHGRYISTFQDETKNEFSIVFNDNSGSIASVDLNELELTCLWMELQLIVSDIDRAKSINCNVKQMKEGEANGMTFDEIMEEYDLEQYLAKVKLDELEEWYFIDKN